ncbi:hypothetical protein [Cochlodiniinecator piscidefendens]|uniref:hypothetical protein n=1 Tax=Cochlodiniinecator piscidefendens TaxID=2715756 RepID=UPI0014085A55|nr:hypothetical protein [Cochlodiniinecator piscidefendens]
MTLNYLKTNNFFAICTLVAMTATGATAQNAYGGYDIAGTPGAVDQDYANVRGWQVTASYVGGRLAYCSAGRYAGGSYMSIGYDGMQWQLAVPIAGQYSDWSGTLEIDGDQRSTSGNATTGNTIAWLGLNELDRLQRGSQAILSVGRVDYDFDLSGVTASTLKVSECYQHGGQVPVQATAPANTASTQNGNAATARVTCETVFNGPFACTLTQQPSEGSYLEVLTVDSDDPNAERYLIKQVNDAQIEVWVSYPDGLQSWDYKGYWQPVAQDQDCMEPAPNQGLAVQDALGQDAWMLCIR